MTEKPKPKSRKKRTIDRLPPEGIAALVSDLVAGNLFTSGQVPQLDLLPMVFLPLSFGAFDIYTKDAIQEIGAVVARMSDAMPRAINGMPMFTACQLVHRDDWTVVVDRYEKARTALNAVAEGRTP